MAKTSEYRDIQLSQLVESPTNPRKIFDQTALAELAASIGVHGIIEPLVVRRRNDGRYEIIAGARRFRAATLAGLERVPCRELALDDDQALEVQIVENSQRADVHPLDEARGFQALLARGKLDVATLAERLSRSPSFVYQRLRLCDLIPAAADAFALEQITAGHAKLLARLRPEQQREAFGRCWRQHWDWTPDKPHQTDELVPLRELAEWIERHLHLRLDRVAWDKSCPELVPAAGPCTTCPKRTGANPLLFDDIAHGDTCTDRTCFDTKLAAFTATCRERGLVQVSWQWHSQEAGVLSPREYVELRPDQEPAEVAGEHEAVVAAVIVDGSRRGEQIRIVVANPAPAAPERQQRIDTDAEREEEQRRAEYKRRQALRLEALAAIDTRLQGFAAVGPHELVAVIAGLWDTVGWDEAYPLAQQFGFAVDKPEGEYETTPLVRELAAKAESMWLPDLVRLTVLAALQPFTERAHITTDDFDPLLWLARQYGWAADGGTPAKGKSGRKGKAAQGAASAS